jgi:hypothetical protein
MGGALSSFDHPGEQRSCGKTCRKCRRHNEHGVALDALTCVIQEFFRSIAALFCGTPHCPCAIRDGIGNRAACARSLVSRFGNVIGSSFQYSLRHEMLLCNLLVLLPRKVRPCRARNLRLLRSN